VLSLKLLVNGANIKYVGLTLIILWQLGDSQEERKIIYFGINIKLTSENNQTLEVTYKV
jgi:hypothetical protein